MLDTPTPTLWPALGRVYQTLSPWSEALLRVAVGLTLVPHGLRMTCGLFGNTGLDVSNLTLPADQLERTGLSPGKALGAGDCRDRAYRWPSACTRGPPRCRSCSFSPSPASSGGAPAPISGTSSALNTR
jgi:hypothetical protein